MCSKYECNGDARAQCTFKFANSRTCKCEKGYLPRDGKPGQDFVDLSGSEVFKGCDGTSPAQAFFKKFPTRAHFVLEVLACNIRGCKNPDGTTIATCEEASEDKRVCKCPEGYAGTLQLAIDQDFPGCVGTI